MAHGGIEPISARQLYAFCTTELGCTVERQTGSHLTLRTPDGRTIRCPDPGSNHPVTSLLLSEIGRLHGKNLYETRAWLRGELTSTPDRTTTDEDPIRKQLNAIQAKAAELAAIRKTGGQITEDHRNELAEMMSQIGA